ncbi:MAG: FG-GAP repeat protein [Flavobacteriales bacterium]
MKTTILLLVFVLINPLLSYSQVGIGTTNPHSSSILEVYSTTKGMLLPRLTNEQISAITDPAEGLLLYSLDENCLINYRNSIWYNLCNNEQLVLLPSFQNQNIIHANDLQSGDQFGRSVSISNDGTTIAVGSYKEDIDLNKPINNAGSVYIYRLIAGNWSSQEVKIQASDKQEEDFFGFAIALSGDGKTLVVGAFNEDGGNGDISPNSGSAYIFKYENSIWQQKQKIQASNTGNGDKFGRSVAINGDGKTIAIGAFSHDFTLNDGSSIPEIGAAYIFQYNGSNWQEQQFIHASDKFYSDFFGWSISLSDNGNTLVVGAIYTRDIVNNILGTGTAYIYKRIGNSWSEQAILKASNAGYSDLFGEYVTISGDGNTVAIGTIREDGVSSNTISNAGAIYIFKFDGVNWNEEIIIRASDKQTNDYFGTSCALNFDGTILIVGAEGEDGGIGDPNNNAGSVYVYHNNESVWDEINIIHANDQDAADEFGIAVAISSDGNTIVIGAHLEDGGNGNPEIDAGAVYIYK